MGTLGELQSIQLQLGTLGDLVYSAAIWYTWRPQCIQLQLGTFGDLNVFSCNSGHLKTSVYSATNGDTWRTAVYSAAIENEAKIKQYNFMPVKPIRNCVGTLKRVRHSMMRRVHPCIDSDGGQCEHLL